MSKNTDPEICPNCGSETNKFVGECDHCGYDRWHIYWGLPQERSVVAQLSDALDELAVWLVPVAAVFTVVSALGIGLATPISGAPDHVAIGLGVLLGAVVAGGYAHERLKRLAELEDRHE